MGAVVWWQNTGSGDYPVQKFSSTPLPDAVATLDFTSAETSWSDLHFDSEGNLTINALTEAALMDAVALLQDQTSARIALLLEKQFGANASQQIMALLPQLKRYQEIEQAWWEENGGNNLSANEPPPHAQLFQLQDELLGEELARQLFSEQRRLMTMMQASHRIRNDTSLTPAEKEQALMELQSNFQADAPSE